MEMHDCPFRLQPEHAFLHPREHCLLRHFFHTSVECSVVGVFPEDVILVLDVVA